MTDDEMLKAIYDTFPTLDEWGDLLTEVVAPSPGSDLALDDEWWPYLPTSTLVSVGLGSAREHLHAVRVLVAAEELFPSATPTLCRSALVGASQSVWILLPDERHERLRRSLSLAVEDYDRHIQHAKDVLEHYPPDQIASTADEQIDRLELRRGQVLSLLDEVGGRCSINLTETVIPAAFEYTVPSIALRGQMTPRWRSMSGAAHALAWHFFGNEGTTAVDLDEGGVGRVNVAGDFERLLMDYFTAYHVAVAGWRLLRERSNASE